MNDVGPFAVMNTEPDAYVTKVRFRNISSSFGIALLMVTAAASTASARPDRAPSVARVAEALGIDMSPGSPLDAEGRAVARAAGRRLLSLCPDCRLSTIDEESPCGWARTNRVLIRKAVAAGMTEDEIVRTYVETYGPEVLAVDTNRGWAATSWILPFSLILISFVLLLVLGYRMTKSTVARGEPADRPSANPTDEAAAAILRAELEDLD